MLGTKTGLKAVFWLTNMWEALSPSHQRGLRAAFLPPQGEDLAVPVWAFPFPQPWEVQVEGSFTDQPPWAN